jgi:hypothetical protein
VVAGAILSNRVVRFFCHPPPTHVCGGHARGLYLYPTFGYDHFPASTPAEASLRLEHPRIVLAHMYLDKKGPLETPTNRNSDLKLVSQVVGSRDHLYFKIFNNRTLSCVPLNATAAILGSTGSTGSSANQYYMGVFLLLL